MKRNTFLALIAQRLKSAPVVALLGPRQCGKTTLARQFAEFRQEVHFFDLEDPTDLAVLENPKLALQDLSGLVVLDEIQRLPDLFPVLRVLVDRPEAASRFLILGSASRDLIRQSSETLAGRISYLELTPFQLGEVGVVVDGIEVDCADIGDLVAEVGEEDGDLSFELKSRVVGTEGDFHTDCSWRRGTFDSSQKRSVPESR